MTEDGKYFGLYRAYVENNKDPENQGRLKLSCPSVYGNDDDSGECLLSNWAYPKYAIGGSQWGTQMVPPVLNPDGSKVMVWLEFEMGDMKYPVWSGCPIAPGKIYPDIDDRIKNQPYLSYGVLITPRGNRIYIDDNDDKGCIELYDRFDQYVKISSADGDEFIEIKDMHSNKLRTDKVGVKLTDKFENIICSDENGIKITDKNGNTFIMSKDGIELNSVKDVLVVATENINITSTKDIGIKSGKGISVAGTDGTGITDAKSVSISSPATSIS